jgi:hypothetical protein
MSTRDGERGPAPAGEPAGLASAFLQSGAKAALGTLWSANGLPASLFASRGAATRTELLAVGAAEADPAESVA